MSVSGGWWLIIDPATHLCPTLNSGSVLCSAGLGQPGQLRPLSTTRVPGPLTSESRCSPSPLWPPTHNVGLTSSPWSPATSGAVSHPVTAAVISQKNLGADGWFHFCEWALLHIFIIAYYKSIIHKDYFNMRFILGEAFCWLINLYTVLCEMWNDI